MNGQTETGDLLKQLTALEARLAKIERTITHESDLAEGGAGSSFLLVEFAALSDLWRDADARIQGTMNLYLAMWATVAAAMVLVYSVVQSLKPLLLGLAVAATLLAGAGVLVSLRVASRAALRNEYVSKLNLIRGYFTQKNAEIGPYLLLGRPDESTAAGQRQARGRSLYGATGTVMVLLNLTDALLLGMAAGVFLWLAVPSTGLAGIVGVAIGVAVACFLLLQWIAQRTLA